MSTGLVLVRRPRVPEGRTLGEGRQGAEPNACSMELEDDWRLVAVASLNAVMALRTARKMSRMSMAYSTVVGPSSSSRKRITLFLNSRIQRPPYHGPHTVVDFAAINRTLVLPCCGRIERESGPRSRRTPR